MGIIFDALLAKAQARGAHVLVQTKMGPAEQTGYFNPITHRSGKVEAVICVRVVSRDVRIISDVEDAICLAHEMGHHRRWLEKLEPEGYRAVVDMGQSTWLTQPLASRQLIVAEERAAWDLARSELESVGFGDWTAFDADRAALLATYERLLGP